MVLRIPPKPGITTPNSAIKKIGFGVRQSNSAAFAAAKPAVKPAEKNPITEPEKETGDPKTISVRLMPSHNDMLEEIKRIGECDKSEAVKRSIRMMALALGSRDAVLHLTDEIGNVSKIPIMVKGRPA